MTTQKRLCGYDHLYERVGRLWPATPGRMVVRAAEASDPGWALDLGCGDGKNLVYLEQLGWNVDGVDISRRACAEARARQLELGGRRKGSVVCADATTIQLRAGSYTLVVAYGLMHCISDRLVEALAERVWLALKPGGLVALAAFNDRLPLPENHGTGGIVLRGSDHLVELFASDRWRRCHLETGEVEEDHEPVIGTHRHSLTWLLVQKRA